MSASMTAPQRADLLEKLLALASLKKEDIAADREAELKHLELTGAKKAVLAEADARIAKATQLDAAMQARENELANGKTQLELDRKQHLTHVLAENTRLEAFAAKLEAQKKQQEKLAEEQLAEADRLRGLGIDMKRQHQEAMTAVQKQEAHNNAVAAANADKEGKLNEREASLKRKAELIRQQMTNL